LSIVLDERAPRAAAYLKLPVIKELQRILAAWIPIPLIEIELRFLFKVS